MHVLPAATPVNRTVLPLLANSTGNDLHAPGVKAEQYSVPSHMLPAGHHKASQQALQLHVNLRHLAAHHKHGTAHQQKSTSVSSLNQQVLPQKTATIQASLLPMNVWHGNKDVAPKAFVSNTVLEQHKMDTLEKSTISGSTSNKTMLGLNHGSGSISHLQCQEDLELDREGGGLRAFTNIPSKLALNCLSNIMPTKAVARPIHASSNKAATNTSPITSNSITCRQSSMEQELQPSENHKIRASPAISASTSSGSSMSLKRPRFARTVMFAEAGPKSEDEEETVAKRVKIDSHSSEQRPRSNRTNAVASSSRTRLETENRASSVESVEEFGQLDDEDEDEEQEDIRCLRDDDFKIQYWAKTLKKMDKARREAKAQDNAQTEFPKLLELVRKIDAGKNWITLEQAGHSKLARNLKKLYRDCDPEHEYEIRHVLERILDNFAQRFNNRRFPPAEQGEQSALEGNDYGV
ncbi:hypothetical protein ID866_4052 [Astraeus odoratus]|nr:hypothetical protein ID866_4052 [Astraeus odoratus]